MATTEAPKWARGDVLKNIGGTPGMYARVDYVDEAKREYIVTLKHTADAESHDGKLSFDELDGKAWKRAGPTESVNQFWED